MKISGADNNERLPEIIIETICNKYLINVVTSETEIRAAECLE